MSFYQMIVNNRIKQITPEALLELGSNYGIQLNYNQAVQVTNIVRAHPINVFDDMQRKRLLGEVAAITSPAVAGQIEYLFNALIKKS